jgi:hypothetical protein
LNILIKKRGSIDLLSTSSRNSIGVFCGDDVVVGLKIVFVEFVDDVRLPIQEKKNFSYI